MKSAIKRILQRLLGFDKYLKVFARFKVSTLKSDPKEGDFFVFMSLLKDKGVILDIGANLGIMTWHLLKHFNKAEIWAFEPMPENNKVLQNTISEFDKSRYRIFDFALGDSRGKVKMVLPEVENVKMQGLSHVVHDSIPDFNDGDFYEVDVEKLDNIIPRDKKVRGIKLDVENYEYFVLRGGEDLIKRDKPIIYMELWDNENRIKCMEYLSAFGYETYFYDGKKLKVYSREKYDGQNFFFITKEA